MVQHRPHYHQYLSCLQCSHISISPRGNISRSRFPGVDVCTFSWHVLLNDSHNLGGSAWLPRGGGLLQANQPGPYQLMLAHLIRGNYSSPVDAPIQVTAPGPEDSPATPKSRRSTAPSACVAFSLQAGASAMPEASQAS